MIIRFLAVASLSFLSVASAAQLQLRIEVPAKDGETLESPGIFLQDINANTPFKFVAADRAGKLAVQLAPGSYQFDTVEPHGMAETFARRRYYVQVDATGAATIVGHSPDASGVYLVKLGTPSPPSSPLTPTALQLRERLTAIANEPASTFKPSSPCQLMDQVTPERSFASDVSSGFPKVRVRLSSNGHIRALVVPVDFPDVAGRDNPRAFFTPIVNAVGDFYARQSYGRVTFDFEVMPDWVHLPFNLNEYGFGVRIGSGDFTRYRKDMVALTEKTIDYSRYDAVYFLVPKEMPFSRMSLGPAITSPTWTHNGVVLNGATGGADMYYNEARGVSGATWKWMAHETGHAFGLVDEDFRHQSPTLGFWSIMANSWSNHAIEHNAWDRYLQGWLDESQVACKGKAAIASSPTSIELSPLVRQGAGIKAVMVPLSPSKILVAESRKNEGLDHIAAAHEGVIVYTVDTAIGPLGGGYRTVRRPGSVDPNFEDAALHPGDSVKVDGVTVTVKASSRDGDTVSLSSR